MSANCEKCGKKPAVVHIVDMMDGMSVNRDLCEDCANIKIATNIPPLQWNCQCGRKVEWRYGIPACGHGAGNYIAAGETEQEVAVCTCGIHYIAHFHIWKCEICGCTSLFPPRLGGGKGFLRDYLYGSAHCAKVEIKGIKDKAQD